MHSKLFKTDETYLFLESQEDFSSWLPLLQSDLFDLSNPVITTQL